MVMRRELRRISTALVLVCAFVPAEALSCSAFILKSGKNVVFAKNFDMMVKEGCLVVNKRGVAKFALAMGSENPAKWTSRYGSVTFNQVAREYPMGGMNEAGLVVEIMWLNEAAYPAPDNRAAIPELQWIQYQLDNCATVAEVLATDDSIRIEPTGKPVHFFVADRAGNAAAMEFLGGRLVCHTGDALPVPVLTNNTYERSCQYLAGYAGFGGTKEASGGWESLDRFVTCASMIRESRGLRAGKIVSRAFDILDAAAQGNGTVWSIVYEQKKLRFRFRTVGMRKIRVVDFERFDFDCGTPAAVLDLEADLEGNVTGDFLLYTTDFNRALIAHTFARYAEENFMSLPPQAQEYLARYPEMFQCRVLNGTN